MAKEKSGKRAHGDGSVYQLFYGTWRGSISVGGGKRKYVRGDTQADVVHQMTEIKAKRDKGLPVVDSRQKFGDYLNAWLRDHVQGAVRPRTYDS